MRTTRVLFGAAVVALCSGFLVGACSQPTVGERCGTDGGVTCSSDEYCALDTSSTCGDTAGTCRSADGGCVLIYLPECGCDHRVYGNACVRERAGVALLPGPCGPACTPGPACDLGGASGYCMACGCVPLSGSSPTCPM